MLKYLLIVENMYGVCLTKLYEDSTEWLKCSDLFSQAGCKLHAMAISHVIRLSLHQRNARRLLKIKLYKQNKLHEKTYILYKKCFMYFSRKEVASIP